MEMIPKNGKKEANPKIKLLNVRISISHLATSPWHPVQLHCLTI